MTTKKLIHSGLNGCNSLDYGIYGIHSAFLNVSIRVDPSLWILCSNLDFLVSFLKTSETYGQNYHVDLGTYPGLVSQAKEGFIASKRIRLGG